MVHGPPAVALRVHYAERIVDVERPAAAGDGVGEAPPLAAVRGGEHVIAEEAPPFAPPIVDLDLVEAACARLRPESGMPPQPAPVVEMDADQLVARALGIGKVVERPGVLQPPPRLDAVHVRTVEAFRQDARPRRRLERLLLARAVVHVVVDAAAHGERVGLVWRIRFAVFALRLASEHLRRSDEIAEPAVAGAVDEHLAAIAPARARQRAVRQYRHDPVALAFGGEHALVRPLRDQRFGIDQDAVGVAFRTSRNAPPQESRLLQDAALTRIGHAILTVIAGTADARMLLNAVVAAEHGTVVHQQRLHPVPCGGNGRAQPAGSSADHHHIVHPAISDCRICAGKPTPGVLKPFPSIRRHVAAIRGEQHGVAARESAREIDKRNRRLAGRELEVSRILPAPAILLRCAQRAAPPAAHLERELSGRMFRQPVLRAHPGPPRTGRRNRDFRLRRYQRFQHALRDEIRAPHLVDELRIDLPAAIVGKRLRLKPQEALHRLATRLRRRAELLQRLGWNFSH